MHCVVTAGPTYEPLDQVRRLTNFSTGRLGTELANHLSGLGWSVTLLLGELATYAGNCDAKPILRFSTTSDLEAKLRAEAARSAVDAVFHAAAVSDFKFGKISRRSPSGQLEEIRSGKIPTGEGALLAELAPTPKLIGQLREWFPAAMLVGWKFEVDGDREHVLRLARDQRTECRTDACVANGPAYGSGFGLVTENPEPQHLPDQERLFAALARMLEEKLQRPP